MKNSIRLAIAWFCYEPKITTQNWDKNGEKFTFVMLPRKYNIIAVWILISPFVFLATGATGVVELFKTPIKIESWSSYRVITSGRKPTKLEMLKKF